MRRRQLTGGTPGLTLTVLRTSDMSPRRLAAGYSPNQKLRQRIHDDRNQEQRQANFNQRGKIDIASRLAELIRQDAGHGVSGRKQGLRAFRTASDPDSDSHGFSKRATW